MPADTLTNPRPRYTEREFDSILAQLQSLILQTRPDLQSDFQQSTLGRMLLETMAFVGDLVSFSADSAAAEAMLDSCRRVESAIRFARSVGYVPRMDTSATADLTAVLQAGLSATGGTVAAGQTFTGPDGTRWELLEPVTIGSGAGTATITVTEGTSRSETFPVDGQPAFTLRTAHGNVAAGSWTVTINGSDWTEVDDPFEPGVTGDVYGVQTDAEGRLIVRFGAGGSDGANVPTTDVTISYRTTQGALGNRSAGSLVGTFAVQGTGVGQPTYSVTFTNADPAEGGADRETLRELKVNVPAYVRNGGKLVTLQDYNGAPRAVSGVALSYADLTYASTGGNVVRLDVWGKEFVTFVSESVEGSQRKSAAGYFRYVTASGTLQTAVKTYVNPRSSVTILPLVNAPPVAWVDIYAREVSYDRSRSAAAVHADLTAAIVAAFEAGNGFSLRLADLYNAARSVAGVRYFTIDRIVFEHRAKPRAAGEVAFAGGLQPADGDRVTLADGVGAPVIFEFDPVAGGSADGTASVLIGANSSETMENFIRTASGRMPTLLVTRKASSTPVATVTHRLGGASFNLPIVVSGVNLNASGMSGGSDTVSTVRDDMRQACECAGGFDPWPPGPYVPGAPFTGSSPWQAGGLPPYKPMADVEVVLERFARRYYDDAYFQAGTIQFNAGPNLASEAQAVNLRRLVLELTPV